MFKEFKINYPFYYAKLHMITFIVFECHRSIDLFSSVIVKGFTVKKSSVMEIKNLVMNTKSPPVKSISKQYQFLFKFPAKKTPILWSFLRKENFF